MAYSIDVNGTASTVNVDADTPLLWVLRDTLGLTGTKFGCGIGMCGACSVHIDGVLVRSCSIPVSDVKGKIVTIEGVAGTQADAVRSAWIAHDVPQCGYCQSGQIMAAVTLLRQKPRPTDTDIDTSMTNICRCCTYVRIRAAIHSASSLMEKSP
ncbi:(2Fe-2S)-binding protein [Paraburkholderia hospita]|uniref:(2Fe-2S)-binding protein n=1 Tax=Paraburkholderia hospita TaxID=169430 RepID=UPI000271939D|nr:(2Fe-2S)-binding protein [Paraburkholderia hospita]EUC12685.1 Isoquinoline 1-oxidoreductase [Burkholderia sp. BT03]SKC47573.1 Aerobic-type carbon monoxide dehydrogenase, small subunit, CoxS/CutS family [Paraburkholderia hospita]